MSIAKTLISKEIERQKRIVVSHNGGISFTSKKECKITDEDKEASIKIHKEHIAQAQNSIKELETDLKKL